MEINYHSPEKMMYWFEVYQNGAVTEVELMPISYSGTPLEIHIGSDEEYLKGIREKVLKEIQDSIAQLRESEEGL